MYSFWRVLGYSVVTLLVFLLAIIPSQMTDPDLWGRFSVAALFFENHQFPYQDVFSFTANGHRWIDHEWLSGFIYYSAMLLGGEFGLHLLKYGLIGLLVSLLFTMPAPGAGQANPRTFFIGLLLSMPLWIDVFYPTVRSQLFTLVFFVLTIQLLERVRLKGLGQKHLLWLILLQIFWANAHGGFVLGLILTLLYGIGQGFSEKSLKEAAAYGEIVAASVITIALLNPYGLAYWPFILKALTMPRPLIAEWSPLSLWTLDFWEIKLVMIATLIGLPVLLLRERVKGLSCLCPALVILFCVALTVKGIRFKPFLILALLSYFQLWVQVLPVAQKTQGQSTQRDFLPLGISVAAVLALLAFLSPQSWFQTTIQDERTAAGRGLIPFPVGVVQALRQSNYQGNLLNPFTQGEFLYWCLYPRFKVSWDGRYEEVYDERQFAPMRWFYAYSHVHEPQAYFAFLRQSKADWVLLEKISPNWRILTANLEWKLVYEDSFYALWGRKALVSGQKTMTSPERVSSLGDFFQTADLRRFRLD